MKLLIRVGISLTFAPLACLYAQLAVAQVKVQPSNFGESTIVQPVDEIRFKLDRLPTLEEGNLIIFIGRTDVTSQFRLIGTEFVYQSTVFPLPLGETKVTVYLVKDNEWKEVVQLPLKVISQQQPHSSGQSESSHLTVTQAPTPDPSSQISPEPQPTQPKPIQTQPSTSAADLNNSFQPQSQQPEQPSKLDPIQVKPVTPSPGFTSTFKPRMTITMKSQFMEQRTGNTEASERPTFTDTTIETGFESEMISDTFKIQSRFSMLGVTFQPEALRFSELGEEAPEFDLSEYQIDAEWGSVQFTMGHLCYGNHPFLLSNVCSRGMTLKANFSDRFDVSINSMNATKIVGFDNLTGLDNFNTNNLISATMGYQLVKNEFGGIRLEATVIDGKRLAEANFNEGQVVDAEKSRGFGVRLFGTDNSGRLRMDVGYARSTFTNPPDRQLVDASPEAEALLAEEFVEQAPIIESSIGESQTIETPVAEELTTVAAGTQELKIVPVEPVTKTAFYGDISYDLLKDVKLGEDRTLSLTLNAHHERIDPQFQTLGATITADPVRTAIGFNASISGAAIQFQQEWTEDNLANVPTILKTKTRNTLLNVNMPLQSIIGSTSRFLPVLSYSYQRVQQVGANVPIPDLSSFDATEIPNQITQQHQAGIQWTFDELSFSYQFSSSLQDNRQPGRENTDFRNLNHQFSFNWQPTPQFQLTIGYNLSSAQNQEEGITQFHSSPTLGLSWEFVKNLTLAMNYNMTIDRDSLNQKFTQATGIEAILTWCFNINNGSRTPIPGSVFVRYSHQSNLNRDTVFDLSTDATIQVINAGLSISF
jgi:hypothetical protein